MNERERAVKNPILKFQKRMFFQYQKRIDGSHGAL